MNNSTHYNELLGGGGLILPLGYRKQPFLKHFFYFNKILSKYF